jgi:putative oligomerization/nucleic acid binding protein
VASVLNRLTSKQVTITILRFDLGEGEAFFHYGGEAPESLRISLSQVFGLLRHGREAASRLSAESELAGGLEKLGSLFERGLLTAEEFKEAKSRLLSN